MIKLKRTTVPAIQYQIQAAHAERIGVEYKKRLVEKGFRFFVDECFAPPEGMSIEDAMHISINTWEEVNDVPVHKNFHS